MKKSIIKDLGWIQSGNQRITIIKALERAMTPTEVKNKTGIKFSNTSDNLRLMTKRGILMVLNPKDKKGRLYELTRKGKELQKILAE